MYAPDVFFYKTEGSIRCQCVVPQVECIRPFLHLSMCMDGRWGHASCRRIFIIWILFPLPLFSPVISLEGAKIARYSTANILRETRTVAVPCRSSHRFCKKTLEGVHPSFLHLSNYQHIYANRLASLITCATGYELEKTRVCR